MPPRSSWKGFINLSLVSVAVKAYSASNTGSTIHLNQLHDACHSRIKLVKTCPLHGEVPNDEIVKGYQYAKDQYVVIDPDELDKLRTPAAQRSIAIDTFVEPQQIDPIYFSDSKYYLVPDGPAGQKPYALLYQAMVEQGVNAVAKVVLFKREQLVLLRPLDNLLCMTVLKFANEIKSSDAFQDERAEAALSEPELELAKTLIEKTTADEFSLDRYRDEYTEKLTQLIESKVSGEELVAPAEAEAQNVINLMEALKASLSATEDEAPRGAGGKKGGSRRTSRKTSASGKSSEAGGGKESPLQKQLGRKGTRKTGGRKKKTG